MNHVFQALTQFENYYDHIALTQRDRVMQRLVAVANLLNQASQEIEDEELLDKEALIPREQRLVHTLGTRRRDPIVFPEKLSIVT